MQVAAAARERADMAEQRLAQRAELNQERQQHIADLTQVKSVPKDMLATPSNYPCIPPSLSFASSLPYPLLTNRTSSVTPVLLLYFPTDNTPLMKACSSSA